MKLFADTETWCEVPIQAGTYRYAAAAEVMLVAYALDDGPVHCWDRTDGSDMPMDLAIGLIEDDGPVIFHNAMFDRAVMRFNMPSFTPPLDRWRCTMARALAHGLPGSLDQLCELFNLPQDTRKLKEGRELVRLFCMPGPKNRKLRRATRETHPQEWARFIEYAKQDVAAMREIDKRLPVWNYRGAELELWRLDQRINDRGAQMDLDLARGAIAATDREQERLAVETQRLTDGVIEAATQRDALLAYMLAEYGIELPDAQGSTVERLLESDPDLPEPVRELLTVRLSATKTSTAKYRKVLGGANVDGRLRGLLQFAGAMRTARWAGRLFQPQNLPRPTMEAEAIEAAVEALRCDVADLVLPGEVMQAASNALRGLIVAPPGRKLVVADLSNIEGRDQAWLAGEAWKLQAFRDFDAGIGPDLYKLAYAKSFGVTPEQVGKPERQIGKVQELALGYQGGVGAFVTMAAGYGMDLDKMARQAWDVLPPDLKAEAIDFHEWQRGQGAAAARALPFEVYVVCETFKRAWRRAHAAISGYWPELEAAAVAAVSNPGETIACRMLKLRRDGAWLRIVLPSGRALCYPHPQVGDDGKLSYRGINQYNRKWQRLRTYGGKLLENACQAVARDVMAAAMPHIEAEGYEIVLTVHDEIIAEAPDSPEYSAEHLSALLAAGAPWTAGMPLAAQGFECYRYRKD